MILDRFWTREVFGDELTVGKRINQLVQWDGEKVSFSMAQVMGFVPDSWGDRFFAQSSDWDLHLEIHDKDPKMDPLWDGPETSRNHTLW
jgi:hypothetical protein